MRLAAVEQWAMDRRFQTISEGFTTNSTHLAQCPHTKDLHSSSSSAPLIKAAPSPHMSCWYSSNHSGSDKLMQQKSWQPLGDTWRRWECDPASTGFTTRYSQLRSDADSGRAFVHGTVPHWGKPSAIRVKGVIEHELTWAYYRMKRHAEHPLRKAVGEQVGIGATAIQFWRDLKPPFRVVEVRRHEAAEAHPDGVLYGVTYMCGLDYDTERQSNMKSDAGTFSNVVSGIAVVRMPNVYPVKRPLQILSWGTPVKGGSPEPLDGFAAMKEDFVNPDVWMPIADELGLRPNEPRLAECREATRRAVKRGGVQVPPLQQLLLGPHSSLPKLARCESMRLGRHQTVDPSGIHNLERGITPHGSKLPTRNHRISTSSVGFLKYSG